MIDGITSLPLTVGLRDDLDDYYSVHNAPPPRAWILSRILVDSDGDYAFSEAEVRDLPLHEVESYWDAFQEAMTGPKSSAPAPSSSAA